MDTSAMGNVQDRADKRDTALLSLQIQAKDINNCDHTMCGWERGCRETHTKCECAEGLLIFFLNITVLYCNGKHLFKKNLMEIRKT